MPEDGWLQIEAPGEHVNHQAKVIQVIDEKAVAAIVNRFNEASKDPQFAGQRIDRDHLSNSLDNPTEALGWVMALRNRGGIPEASIKWTAIGRPLVKPDNPQEAPVYKFFSTEYDPEQCEVLGQRIVNGKPYKIVRPLVLAGLALTNDPNNRGQRPISNRDGNDAGAAKENQPRTTMKKVNALLGLAEDASEDSAVAAIQAIQNRASKAEGQVTTLTTERNTLLGSQVEADLTKYKNRFKQADREKWKSQLIANRAVAIELLESIEEPKASETESVRITNRAAAKTPEQIQAEKQQASEDAMGARISNRAAELRAVNPRLSRSQAFAKAKAELYADK